MKISIEEIIDELSSNKDKGYKRFNKSAFTKLVNAVASDPDFISEVTKVKSGQPVGHKEIPISKNLRKWVKSTTEKLGLDPSETQIIMEESFDLPSMDWVYDFITEVIYIYIKTGNRFEFPKKDRFQGSLYLKELSKTTTERKQINPVTKEITGPFKITKEDHDELKVKSTCPKYLMTKEEES